MPVKPGQSMNNLRLLTSLNANLLPIIASTSVNSLTPNPATIVYS